MQNFLKEITECIHWGLENKGLSASRASSLALGESGAIHRIMQGHMPSVERLKKLCDFLGIEFSLKAGKHAISNDLHINETLLSDVIDAVETHLKNANLELSPSNKARLICTLYEMAISNHNVLNQQNVTQLVRLVA